ncbi:MAG TPA: hypothetical protein VND21_10540 [Planctomycetota bacterium]|nr:hypothetical protein [Planctomycetota bacterium]
MGGIRIDARPSWAVPTDVLGRAEGVAYSRCGQLLAVAQAEDGTVALFERAHREERFEARQAGTLGGPHSGLDYPHDVDFSPDGRVLAVANRESSAITFYAREGAEVRYGPRPTWTIARRPGRLAFTDAVKFVPPDGRFVAAVSLARNFVTFYRRSFLRRSRWGPRPCFVLEGPETRLGEPDGLAFTSDGRLLAVTNHGAGTVTIYARHGRAPRYGPAPLVVLGAPDTFRCPHSVAFSPSDTHLAISNAGGRAVLVYRVDLGSGEGRVAFSEAPVLELDACDAGRFEARNRDNRREGGPKGIAFGGDCLAICSEHLGLRVHRAEFVGGRAAPAAPLTPATA